MKMPLRSVANPAAQAVAGVAHRLSLAALLFLSLATTPAAAELAPTSPAAFANWLQAYGSAWMHRDPNRVFVLFARDARYYETPFDKPMIGRAAIYRYWSEGVKSGQRDVTFQATPLYATSKLGVAHWRASFVRVPSREVVELDGILQARFDASGQCIEFREWWHRSERPRA